MVDTDVASAFVEFPHRLVDVVVTQSCVARVVCGIKLNYPCGDGIDHGRRNYTAVCTERLGSASTYGLGRRRTGQALEVSVCSSCVRILEDREGTRSPWIAERIQIKVVITSGVGCHHCSRGNQAGKRYSEALHLRLIVKKEESFVLSDRAAQRAAKLIQIKLVSSRSEIVAGIKDGVPKILEQSSVKLVRSRFCCDQNRRTRTLPPLRRVVVGQNLKFLDGIDRRKNRNPAFVELVIIVPVQHPICTLSSFPAHGNRKSPARGGFGAGRSIEETVGVGFRCRTRSQGR